MSDALTLPWLLVPLTEALRTQQAHALLVTGPSGLGQWEFGLALAQAWLCETDLSQRPTGQACGHCEGCHLVAGRSHPDLRLLVPEAMRAQAGLNAEEAADAEDGKKRKPSREIKVDQVRTALDFSERTAGRGGLKVVLVHPAEAMNAVAANALLKTLEEPPGAMRFVLACGAPQALLPTIRSRCQAVLLPVPERAQALAWLSTQGLQDPGPVLDASGGLPLSALAHAQAGRDAAAWRALPTQVLAGDAAALGQWPLPVLADALGRLCHDAAALSMGVPARFFPAWQPATEYLDAQRLDRLTQCAAELRRFARQAEHPWNGGLAVESLVAQVRWALTGPTASR
jgi:DNA polymerase-3 subunit delta'